MLGEIDGRYVVRYALNSFIHGDTWVEVSLGRRAETRGQGDYSILEDENHAALGFLNLAVAASHEE